MDQEGEGERVREGEQEREREEEGCGEGRVSAMLLPTYVQRGYFGAVRTKLSRSDSVSVVTREGISTGYSWDERE